MLYFIDKTTYSLLFDGITPSNISNNLRTIVHEVDARKNTLQFYSYKLM